MITPNPPPPAGASLLAGTPGDDTLTASEDGDILSGLGGDDRLDSISWNDTTLFGGLGNDALLTVHDLAVAGPGAPDVRATQYGGDGDDRLEMRLSVGAGLSGRIFATADGGIGNDRIVVGLQSGVFDGVEDSQVLANVAGGPGDDIVEVRLLAIPYSIAGTRSSIFGGGGNDVISVSVVHGGGSFDEAIANVIFGEAGSDTVAAQAEASGDGLGGTIGNSLYGGSGNDNLQATASSTTNSFDLVRNIIIGGTGNDVVISETLTNTNSSSPLHDFFLNGGAGADRIDAIWSATGDSLTRLSGTLIGGDGDDRLEFGVGLTFTGPESYSGTVLVDGGAGRDHILVDHSTDAYDQVSLSTFVFGGSTADTIAAGTSGSGDSLLMCDLRIDGGSGDDQIIATATSLISYSEATAISSIAGGAGKDSIVSDLALDVLGTYGAANIVFAGDDQDFVAASLDVARLDPTATGSAFVYLDGGTVRDHLVATITGDGLAHAILVGGQGYDWLQVTGGEGNVLSGGLDDDNLWGSAAADIFEFVAGDGYGLDRVNGFDRTQDALNILAPTGALADLGAAGLADDIDAICEVRGAGWGAVIDFGGGILVRILGSGFASADSIADLVDDPRAQLLSDATLAALPPLP
jgi:Ca2+-binding RTX toxin-like protein